MTFFFDLKVSFCCRPSLIFSASTILQVFGGFIGILQTLNKFEQNLMKNALRAF